jgi:hypothetical protein
MRPSLQHKPSRCTFDIFAISPTLFLDHTLLRWLRLQRQYWKEIRAIKETAAVRPRALLLMATAPLSFNLKMNNLSIHTVHPLSQTTAICNRHLTSGNIMPTIPYLNFASALIQATLDHTQH